ncbi:MAG: single-stranded DNA-binding protein [Mesobacillus sp.]
MINQVTLVGRLTRDPELRFTPDGKAVSNITLAVNRHYKNASGEIEADFVHCILWGKTAENTANYCKKGAVLGVTGRIQTRNYDNQEGKRVYVTEVVAEGVRFLSSKPSGARETQQPSQQSQAPLQPQPVPMQREELPFV